ncbi:hypothetical protein, partial [uncultured Parabacteroides sp.]
FIFYLISQQNHYTSVSLNVTSEKKIKPSLITQSPFNFSRYPIANHIKSHFSIHYYMGKASWYNKACLFFVLLKK